MVQPAQALSSKLGGDVILLAALAGLLCLTQLGTGSLRSWDEATYGQVAREFLQTGDWLTPRMSGEPWFDKPPLMIWGMAIGYSLLGVGELATRLGSALTGIAGILLVYVFARRAFGRRCGLFSALFLLSTPHFLIFAKMGMLDVPLTLFVSLCLYGYWRALSQPTWFLLAGAAFGLSFMTKHVAAGVAPVAALLHAVALRRLDLIRSPYLWWGAALALAVLLPWHLALLWSWGREFWEPYVEYHILSRGVRVIQGHEGGPFFHFGVLAEEYRPWFILSLVSVPYCAVAAYRERSSDLGLFLIWAVAAFGLATIIPTKLRWYIMPIYPALAVCSGFLVARIVPERYTAGVVGVILAVLAVQGFTTQRIFDLDYSPESKELGYAAGRVIPQGDPLYTYEISAPAIRFYAERSVVILDGKDLKLLQGELQARDLLYLVTRERFIEDLREALPGRSVSVLTSSGEWRLAQLSAEAG